MVTMPSCRHHGASVTQVVARRQVRMHLRKIREREYSKLRALVPSIASKKKVTKVQVIEEAVRYIEELQSALLERLRQKHGSMAEDKAHETVETFVSRMMSQNTSSAHSNTHSESVPPLISHPTNSFDKSRNQTNFLSWKTRTI